MMKRNPTLLAVVLATFLPHVGWAAAPGSPEYVVERALDALNRGRIDTFVKAMHPDALNEFRTTILDILDAAAKVGKQAELLEAFQGVSNADELKALDGPRLFSAMLGKATSAPEAKQALASTRIDAIGRIVEGKDKAYVVYRSKMNFGGMDIERLNVASLQKSGPDWKLLPLDDLDGRFAAMKQRIAGDLKLADLSATKVEVLGHVLEGKRTAMVAYRALTPIGDSFFTKLGALRVNAGDPGWDAVRKEQTAEVKALVEKSLGIRKPPSAEEVAARKAAAEQLMQEARARAGARPGDAPGLMAKRQTPEESSARRAEAEKRLEEMKARMGKTRGGDAGRSSARRPEDPARAQLPEGLTALPSSFFGGDRDRFHDVASAGGVLVGARVSYIMRFGGPKISSVRPVYRVGDKLVDGKRYGTLLGKEAKALAKPGYAVGAVNTHTGLTVDGFELVFMRIDGDRLDSSDSYKSPWLGDEKGGSPRNVSSDGKIPVGLQGRAGREVNALGLIVGE